MSRLRALRGDTFDVAVIGGGIIGCGIARDAARRGLRVVLFDQGDFGGGTTSASTRIVHGGLRYLETADFRLVRMDLRERETLLRIAGHLVTPLQFVIPFAHVSRWQQWKLRAGLILYDALAAGSTLPRHRAGAHEATYFDARIDSPERLCLENLADAAVHGARVCNYTDVVELVRQESRVTGVRIRDRLEDFDAVVPARMVVNASGPWLSRASGLAAGVPPGAIRTTKGVHLVTPPLTDRAQVLFSSVDGRLMFAIPRAGLTWLGTTDTDYEGDPRQAVATRADVEYIVHSLRPAFPSLRVDDVLFSTAGVRALVMQPGRASAVSRLHRIVDGEAHGAPGMVTILGAKITGYRAIAEEATDVVCRRLGVARSSDTAEALLPGAGRTAAALKWPHLAALYGSRAAAVEALAAEDPELARPLSPRYPDVGAQVVFAARHEQCLTVADFIRRRSLLGATADQGWDAVESTASLLAGELGWTAAERERHVAAYAVDIQHTLAFVRS
jgi:glycerol-3-phosphate dehydrogenase